MKDIHIMNPEPILEPTTEKQLRGFQFEKAPQTALTTPVSTAFTQSGVGPYLDGAAIARLNNMYTRLGELEDRMIKLGLLQKT